MATKTNRLGETRMMNCGMEATIIRYGKYSDMHESYYYSIQWST